MIRYVCAVIHSKEGTDDQSKLYRLITAHDVEDADRQLADFANPLATTYAHGLRLAPDEIVHSVAQPDLEALYDRLRPSALFASDPVEITRIENARRSRVARDGIGKHYSVLEAADEAAPRPKPKPKTRPKNKTRPKPKSRPKPKPKSRPKPKQKRRR